jgi:hypothetical protein
MGGNSARHWDKIPSLITLVNKMFRNLWSKTRQQISQIRMGTSMLIDQTKAALILKQKPPTTLVRQEFRLIEQNRRDIGALVPFVLCTIIIPELLPLMILKGRVPSTMMTNAQLQQRKIRLSQRRLEIAKKFVGIAGATNEKPMSELNTAQLRDLNEFFVLRKYQLPWSYRTSLESHLEYLSKDDTYLVNSVDLSNDAIEAALFERGIHCECTSLEAFIALIKERQEQSNVVYWTLRKTLQASEEPIQV